MTKDKIKIILLDLGGVIIRLTGADWLIELTGAQSKQAFNNRWNQAKSIHRLETGKCSAQEFAEEIVAELEIPVSPDDFLKKFLYFPKDFYPGAESLLTELSENYFTASFSNTSAFHWDRLCGEFRLSEYFHKNFLSFETGNMKPHAIAYQHVIGELNCLPEKIVFFDDNEVNITGAKECGINAYRVDGIVGLRNQLSDLGLLP